MRKLAVPFVVLICLFAAQSAAAAIPNVFGTLTCTVQGSGQRFCGPTLGSTQPSFDGAPIDVSVAFPPVPAVGPDGNFPVIGLYHGYGNQKIVPSSATAQRWLNQGYAVFAIQDRGFYASCGALVPIKPAACAKGYIHLLHNAYEVRDAQYLLGKLADQHVIDPQRIGATGGSYGGGMSAQLGALKDRTQMFDGSTVQWRSPVLNRPMRIAATAPEFPWTDLAQSLMPNGSNLDYVADSPYLGPLGDHRFGIQKQKWNTDLYNGGAGAGLYAAPALNDPTANVTNWKGLNDTGGPYDGAALAIQQINELPNHGAYGTNMDEPPAPALLSSGWNDDLFPVDETVRYYNKVRAKYPSAAIKLFYLDFGHNPRAATPAAADAAKLVVAENAWFNYYVKGAGSAPAASNGGVDAITSACPAATAGTLYTAPNWASLAPGEIRFDSPATQTITAPGTAPSNAFIAGTICTTTSSADNASAATYKLPAAPAGGYTVLGSST